MIFAQSETGRFALQKQKRIACGCLVLLHAYTTRAHLLHENNFHYILILRPFHVARIVWMLPDSGSDFVAANNAREWHGVRARAKEMRIFTLCIIILIFAVGWTFRSFSVCVFFFIVGGSTKLPRLILLPSFFFFVLSFRFVLRFVCHANGFGCPTQNTKWLWVTIKKIKWKGEINSLCLCSNCNRTTRSDVRACASNHTNTGETRANSHKMNEFFARSDRIKRELGCTSPSSATTLA